MKKEIKKQSPDYDVVPLEYDDIGVVACQMGTRVLVDPKNPKEGRKQNLDHMSFLMERAMGASFSKILQEKRLHLLVFPEFGLTGMNNSWTREEFERIAIDVPGEETEAIGRKAKELDCYVVFCAHTKDRDWPGHYFHSSLIVDPKGEVIHQHWKAYTRGPGLVEYATTVHDVLDEFVDRYGWDAVWPVARTPIGNIATFICSEGFAPETARAFAFQGAEIICWCIAGGGDEYQSGKLRTQMRAYCGENEVYGVYCTLSNGGSMIVDPYGRVLNQAVDCRSTVVYDTIPISSFRAKHKRPYLRTEIYVASLEHNEGKWPANMYSKYGVPSSNQDAARLFSKYSRW
ncbi:nitrilase-related carbon-nitrogen hydrolase [Chloroflexota bacterium]